ncbi:MAG TPA: PhoPQ-activated pathogenicity-related family protein [Candidatus Dormibacteraeota bacterium]|nr:PhoPQ-activated pathogenicity-related family protein [Candidatus Dormibacteraeota bacterium]
MTKRTGIVVALVVFLGAVQAASSETALDRYVHAPDAAFNYQCVKTLRGPGYTTYVLDMTSQSYLTEGEVNRPVWKHWVTIVKPDKVKTDVGLLFIGGGDNGDAPPEKPDPLAAEIAAMSGAVVAQVSMVPNQPLIFSGETRERSEDAIIAYTWDKFLRTGEEKWPLRLPMTKAAVRAMDAVSGFLSTGQGGKVKVDKYVVTGESKRGWTTWTTAAVDRRVIAIMPMVIDVLNIVPSMAHHYRVYGSFSSELDDYAQAGIMQWSGTAEYQKLMQIEEPFQYRERLTMPKYIINASGDQFFVPDSWQFYFDQLPGEKYLRYVPNADHGVRDHSDVGESISAFFGSVVAQTKRPNFTWRIEKDGTIVVDSTTRPMAVKLWAATNPEARDFRLEKIGAVYTSRELSPTGPGHYAATVHAPPKGYTAYFIELTYPSAGKYPFKFTTGVKVLPDAYPSELPKIQSPSGSHGARKMKSSPGGRVTELQ